MASRDVDTLAAQEVHADPRPRDDRWIAAILIVLTLVVGTILLLHTETTPVINDTIGYVYAALRMADGAGPSYADAHNATIGPYFAPAAFQIRRTNDDLLFLGFPPGFPALMALVVTLARTPTAVHYAAPLLTLIGLVATYFMGALAGGRRAVGLWAALLLAASPSFWQFGTAAWSEAPSLALGTAGVALFLAARRSERGGRSRMLALAAGLLLAYNIFVRYANVAILPGFLLFDLWCARTALLRPNRRWWFYLPLVAGVAAVPLFNMVYYGGPLITSYNPLHGWYPHAPFALGYAFGPSFVGGRSLLEMPPLLWANFGFFLLALPVGWILLPRPVALLTAAAALLTMGLYGIYAFAPVGINSRFLLPIFPFLCVPMAQTIVDGGQWLGDRLRTRFPRPGWASVGHRVAAVVLLLLMFRPLPDTLAALEQRTRDGAAVASRMQELTAGTPDDSVFLSYEFNDHIAYYGARPVFFYRRIPVSDPAAGRYQVEMLEPCLVLSVDRLLAEATPVYYVVDRTPSFWGALDILQRYFTLTPVREGPTIYAITNDAAPPTHRRDLACPTLAPR